MTRDAARAVFLDASVLVALYSSESRSELIRQRCANESLKYTTPFCYFEAMNIFKSKWKFQSKMDFDSYKKSCTALTAWYGATHRRGLIKDVDFSAPEILRQVRELVDRSNLDFSDAFQVFSVKYGYFSQSTGESATILATTDAQLAQFARTVGVRAWHIEREDQPT